MWASFRLSFKGIPSRRAASLSSSPNRSSERRPRVHQLYKKLTSPQDDTDGDSAGKRYNYDQNQYDTVVLLSALAKRLEVRSIKAALAAASVSGLPPDSRDKESRQNGDGLATTAAVSDTATSAESMATAKAVVVPLVEASTANATEKPSIDPALGEAGGLRGLYLYGSVGTGKTFLMDLFFENVNISSKRRVHFHKFMLEIHQRIHRFKQDILQQHGRDVNINTSSERDAIVQVARQIAAEAQLLCFDEFQVTDICDAMILSKFFGELWARGTVLVATSNRPPSDLYKDGLNRSYFLPFIRRLEELCVVKHIASTRDYRQDAVQHEDTYFMPLGAAATDKLIAAFWGDIERRGSKPSQGIRVPVMMNRVFTVPVGDLKTRICYVDFARLCEEDRGAADYQALCRAFDTIYLDGVPALNILKHDNARRFITFVDEVYDANVRLRWTAACTPHELFRELTTVEVQGKGKVSGAFGTDHAWGGAGSTPPVTRETAREAVQRGTDMLVDSISSK